MHPTKQMIRIFTNHFLCCHIDLTQRLDRILVNVAQVTLVFLKFGNEGRGVLF